MEMDLRDKFMYNHIAESKEYAQPDAASYTLAGLAALALALFIIIECSKRAVLSSKSNKEAPAPAPATIVYTTETVAAEEQTESNNDHVAVVADNNDVAVDVVVHNNEVAVEVGCDENPKPSSEGNA